MSAEPQFDLAEAHRYFAANCFNTAWELIDQTDRTADDDEQMLHRAHASVWHWTQRSDCTDRNLSIGYWLLSRVHCLVGRGAEGLRYAGLCLEITPPDDAFCLGYGHEAAARASGLCGDEAGKHQHLAKAEALAAAVTDAHDRELLTADLQSLG